jgi:hypothetical protein
MCNRYIGLVATFLVPVLGTDAGFSMNLQLVPLSGDRQRGVAGQTLPEPIVARLIDDAGNGAMDRLVTLEVDRGNGRLIDTSGSESLQLVLRTDARGDVYAGFRLGVKPGSKQNLVSASSLDARNLARFHLWAATNETVVDTTESPAPTILLLGDTDLARPDDVQKVGEIE